MQKGVACECWQNEFLFKATAICTSFGVICCKMECVLPLNGVRFGAKRLAFWCKTQGVLVQNESQNAAKCETKSINFHSNCINKTFQSHKTHG